jgi:hypothetical protein
MNRRTSIIALAVLIAAAVLFGLVLINKGDGPVMGMIISDKAIGDVENYKNTEAQQDQGTYMVLAKEFNKLNKKLEKRIPSGRDLYANVYVVECPKGTEFTAKWIMDGKNIKEETRAAAEDARSIVTYLLEGSNAKAGGYTFELYKEDHRIFSMEFSVE